MASWTTWLQLVPLRNRADLGFSMAFGAFFSKMRLDRALRGLLTRMSVDNYPRQ